MVVNKKSQTFSMDIILGVIIFMGAFFVIYALLNANPNTKTNILKREASSVINQIASEDTKLTIIDGNEVNKTKLNQLKNVNYEELKRNLSIESDFCIYFEDEKGYIVLIDNSYKGIGTPNINLSGTPCSQR